MKDKLNRRNMLCATLTGSGFLASGQWPALGHLMACSANHTLADTEIERLAGTIMEAEPNAVVELMVEEMRKGLSPRSFWAACLNAGIRFHGHHSAYVSHPVGVMSHSIPQAASPLPLFYHLSVLRFRAPRAALRWLDKSKLPNANGAESRFHDAMLAGERDDAGLAMIAMSRAKGPQQAYRHLFAYAAERNHNSGGHTAISVVNTLRTLIATDWTCAETALQFAVTDEAWRKPGGSQDCHENRRRAEADSMPPNWSSLGSELSQVRELVSLFRMGNPEEACAATFQQLAQGKLQAGSVWDALFLTTAEMVVRYKFVGGKRLAGHSITCVNALHYLFRNAIDRSIRQYCMLEAIEWTTSFLARERARPALREFDLLELEPTNIAESPSDGLDEIFELLPPRRFAAMHRPGFTNIDIAMQKTLAWLHKNDSTDAFLQRAMWLMCIKSTPEVHDFKYPMALFENARYATAHWRPYLLAASMHVLHGTSMEDSEIVQQARERLS